MSRNNQSDLRLLKKARHRVHAMLIVSYLFLCLWPAGVYVLLNQPFFSRPDSFTLVYLISMLVSMVIWMAIFFVVSDGRPAMRNLILAGIVVEFLFVGWLVYSMITLPDISFLPVYLIWAVLELVKDFYLCWMLGWMKNSWWAKIFFDHTIELSESERIEEARRRERAARARAAAQAKAEQEARARADMEARRKKTSYATQAYRQSHQPSSSSFYATPDIQQGQPADAGLASRQASRPAASGYSNSNQVRAASLSGGASQSAGPGQAYTGPASGYSPSSFESSDFQTDEELAARTKRERERANRKHLSSAYPRTAIRLALVVYGELILFPVAVHIFQNSFVSIDNSSVFAVNLMFTLCILSAVVWTLPIFFLYLKQPGVKKMLVGAVLLQLAVIAFGAWVLYGYYNADPAGVVYSTKVFTLFGMLEVLRYGLLLAGILPAFRLPEIRDRHTSKLLSTPQEEEESYEFELIDEESGEDMDASLDDLFDEEEQEDRDWQTAARTLHEAEYDDDSEEGYAPYDEYDGYYEEDGTEADENSRLGSFQNLLHRFRK